MPEVKRRECQVRGRDKAEKQAQAEKAGPMEAPRPAEEASAAKAAFAG